MIAWESLNRAEGEAVSVAVFDLREQVVKAMRAATGTPALTGLHTASQILSDETERRISDLARREAAYQAGDLSALR